LTEIAEEVKIH